MSGARDAPCDLIFNGNNGQRVNGTANLYRERRAASVNARARGKIRGTSIGVYPYSYRYFMKKEGTRLIAKLPATSCRCQAIDHREREARGASQWKVEEAR
jgi:hypothetical protein